MCALVLRCVVDCGVHFVGLFRRHPKWLGKVFQEKLQSLFWWILAWSQFCPWDTFPLDRCWDRFESVLKTSGFDGQTNEMHTTVNLAMLIFAMHYAWSIIIQHPSLRCSWLAYTVEGIAVGVPVAWLLLAVCWFEEVIVKFLVDICEL